MGARPPTAYLSVVQGTAGSQPDTVLRAKWGKTLALPGRSGSEALQFRTAGADIVWSATQRALLRMWADLRGRKSLPSWDDLAADELSGQRDTLMLLDAVDDDGALRFHIGTLGSRIAKGYGGDFTGRFLDEAIPPAWRDNAMQTYRAVVVRGRPIYNVVDKLDREGSLVRMERLLLPFSGQDIDAEHVLASVETSSIAGQVQDGVLGHWPYADSSCAVVAVIDL